MPFPQSPREVYDRNPLKEVICQVTFPPILQITAEDPVQFQNAIRRDYPIYEREVLAAGAPPEITQILLQFGAARHMQRPIHKFFTVDRQRFISLSEEFVAVTETDYTRRENLRAEVQKAEVALQQCYEPMFYSRVGLRYLDVIDKVDLGVPDCDWRELLNPALLGVLCDPDVGPGVTAAQCQTLINLGGTPSSTVNLQNRLASVQVEGGATRQVYLIDSDFFTNDHTNPDQVFGALDRFANVAGDLFRWAVTDRLRQALGRRPQ